MLCWSSLGSAEHIQFYTMNLDELGCTLLALLVAAESALVCAVSCVADEKA